MQTFQEYVEAGNQNMGFNHHTNEVLEQPFITEKISPANFQEEPDQFKKDCMM